MDLITNAKQVFPYCAMYELQSGVVDKDADTTPCSYSVFKLIFINPKGGRVAL